ncbi:UNVERIFIED_CONTAM: hypothetical protein K2H54_037359 [Gekko kuhli]
MPMSLSQEGGDADVGVTQQTCFQHMLGRGRERWGEHHQQQRTAHKQATKLYVFEQMYQTSTTRSTLKCLCCTPVGLSFKQQSQYFLFKKKSREEKAPVCTQYSEQRNGSLQENDGYFQHHMIKKKTVYQLF